ncbi:MAG: type IV toxin-antitoxin system AbiEi family antitoxin [Beutenbergiaceae bacterium]
MSLPTLPEVLTVATHGYGALRPAIASGELRRVRRGAYRRPAAGEQRWQSQQRDTLARCVAVAERLECEFAFSHQTAALLLGWPVAMQPQVHLTQTSHPSKCRQDDLTRHFASTLPEQDLTRVHGLPVTSPERTLLDCARILPAPEGLIVCDGGLRVLASMSNFDRIDSLERQAVLRRALLARLSALGPVRNVVRARAVLRHADGLSQSPGESRVRWLGLAIGLPEPTLQWQVTCDGDRYFTDIAWLGEQWTVAAEYDGAIKYGTASATPQALVAEKIREDRIRATGAAVVRFTSSDLADLAGARSRLLAAFPPSVAASLTPRSGLALRQSGRRRR